MKETKVLKLPIIQQSDYPTLNTVDLLEANQGDTTDSAFNKIDAAFEDLDEKIEHLNPVTPNPVEPDPALPKLQTVGINGTNYKLSGDGASEAGTGIKIQDGVVSIDTNTAYVNKIEGATDTDLHQWAFVTQAQYDELDRTNSWLPGVYYTITDDSSYEEFLAEVRNTMDTFNQILNNMDLVFLRDSDVVDEITANGTHPVQAKTIYQALHNLDLSGVTDASLSSTSTNPVQNKVIYENLYIPVQQIDTKLAKKQDALRIGTGIEIDANNVISVKPAGLFVAGRGINIYEQAYGSEGYIYGDGYEEGLATGPTQTVIAVDAQNLFTAGTGISISPQNEISAFNTLQAGNGIQIQNNTITNTAIVTVDSEINSQSTNPVQNKAIYEYLSTITTGNTTLILSNEAGSPELPVLKKLTINDSAWALSNPIDSTVTQHGQNPVTSEGIYNYVESELDRLAVTVDSELSLTSENPVQNKVISNILDGGSVDIVFSSNYIPEAPELTSVLINGEP